MRKKLISIDFDGVLNSYTSGWTGPGDTPDAPVPGAMRFLADLVDDPRFDAVIYSSRCASEEGVLAIRQWLDRHLVAELGEHAGHYVGNRIRVAASKPPAFVHIDDRAICFDGTWPSLDEIDGFVPWNKKPPSPAYRHMSTAPKDGTLIRLLIEQDEDTIVAFEDTDGPFWTIGFNNFESTQEDCWQFVGWDWQHDHMCEVPGTPIGWSDFSSPADAPIAPPMTLTTDAPIAGTETRTVSLNGRLVELSGLALEVAQTMEARAKEAGDAAFQRGWMGGLGFARNVATENNADTAHVLRRIDMAMSEPDCEVAA
jgi:hypothetical protein